MVISDNTGKIIISFILGGAVGNVYDRFTYFAVPDFIDFHVGNMHWFTFNFADIFISLGIFAMVIKEFILKKIHEIFKNFFYFCNFNFLISGCGNFRDAVTGQKKTTTDEFLIKKKDPLILPPDYDNLPIPKSKKTKDVNSSLEAAIGDVNNSNLSSEYRQI